MSAERYYASGISQAEASLPALASRPAPSDVIDGRFFGDELWELLSPTTAATADQAAKISAVNFCVSLIAETVGSLPFALVDAGGEVDDPLADTLAYAPNPMQTGAEFWASMAYRAALGGQAFAEPVLTYDDSLELWPLHPDRMSIEWRERNFRVVYADEGQRQRVLTPPQLFWFSGLADAGKQPLTPWKMAKGSIDFALALETQGRTFFQNGTKLSGVLSSETKLDNDVIVRLQGQVRRWKTGSTPVLEQGLKYSAIASTNTDSQLAELIKQRTLEMARYWRIPRSMIGEDGGPAGNQEQEALGFEKYTIRPWTRRMEQAVTQRLLTPDQRRRGLRAKFNLDGLLRGDSATQWRNAVLARTASAMSANELRTRWFGMPRINKPWADDAQAPLNSNRAADTASGGETAPQDKLGAAIVAAVIGEQE